MADDTDANTCKPYTGTKEDGKVYFYRLVILFVRKYKKISNQARDAPVTAESTEVYFDTKCGPTPTVEEIDGSETLVFKTYICTKLDEELSNGMITGVRKAVSCFER